MLSILSNTHQPMVTIHGRDIWYRFPFCRPFCGSIDQPQLKLRSQLLIVGLGFLGWLVSFINHRGIWQLSRIFSRVLSKLDRELRVKIATDSILVVESSDPYWLRILASSYEYERSLEFVLWKLPPDFTFIDCGANSGYWSVLLSGNRHVNRPVLSIEAYKPTFDLLTKTASCNDNRFAIIHKALSNIGGQQVLMAFEGDHAATRMAESRTQSSVDSDDAQVSTITLDDAILKAFGVIPEKLIIKLDVEGQEVNTLMGGNQVLRKNFLLYYEDHGKEIESQITDYLLNCLDMAVFYFQDNRILNVTSIADVRRIKVQSIAYNFFACSYNSGYYEDLKRLAEARGSLSISRSFLRKFIRVRER
jgi:FkbM family methyltransferase